MPVKNLSITSLFLLVAVIPLLYVYRLTEYKDEFQKKKERQYIKKIVFHRPYKNIYDVNGYPIALSIPQYSYFVDTTFAKDEEDIKKIASFFHYDIDKLLRKYKLKKKFVWLKRKSKNRIKHPFKSVFEIVEFGRFYPYGKMVSHIVGIRNREGEALGGLELSLNDLLYNGKQVIKFIRSADGRRLLLSDFSIPVSITEGVSTTLDIMLQSTLYKVALQSYKKWQPEKLVAIAVDPQTGDIMAWVQIPTFDPYKYNVEPLKLFNNIALTSPVEPGSLFKPFFYYTLLKKGIVNENTKVFCENGHYMIRARHIYDHTPHNILSAREVIAYSSNIGITKLSQKLNKEDFLETLKTFRFLDNFSIGFVNTLKSRITPYNRWSYHTLISLPMGYEILTTPFHLIRAYSAFANGGYLVDISILKKRKILKRKILDEEVVQKVRDALGLVTKIGTAKRANSKLYIVEGKTGTSKLLGEDKKYTATRHRSFFIGFAPQQSSRQLLVYFQLDNPRGAYFGGTVAAPYVKEFLEKSLQKLFIKFELNATENTNRETTKR